MNPFGYDMHLFNISELHLTDSILPLYYKDEIVHLV